MAEAGSISTGKALDKLFNSQLASAGAVDPRVVSDGVDYFIARILKRHGLVPKKRSRRRIGHPGQPTTAMLAAALSRAS